jgi:hypothetical protein
MATRTHKIPGDFGSAPYAGMTASETCGCEHEDDTEWVEDGGPVWARRIVCLTCGQEVEFDCG